MARDRTGPVRGRVRRLRAPVRCGTELPGLANLLRPRNLAGLGVTDEWYVFFENPKNKGFKIIYNINGDQISHDGNMLWMTDKNFGMGKDHPVAWYNTFEKGKTFYTSIGHDSRAWKNENFLKMIENALKWGISK